MLQRMMTGSSLLAVALWGCSQDPPRPQHVMPFEGATHVIAPAAEYYLSLPEEGQNPDGVFPAGTRVEVLEKTQQYLKVRTSEDTEAFVKVESIRKQTPDG